MEQKLLSSSLRAFDLIRSAALEYNNSHYKFYSHGFFKYSLESESTMFIEDIYLMPEFRGTPVSSIMLSNFTDYIKETGVIFIYGYVMKASKLHKKRLDTFNKWGLNITNETDTHYVVGCLVKGLKNG